MIGGGAKTSLCDLTVDVGIESIGDDVAGMTLIS
jgi:hypothetical protein